MGAHRVVLGLSLSKIPKKVLRSNKILNLFFEEIFYFSTLEKYGKRDSLFGGKTWNFSDTLEHEINDFIYSFSIVFL